MKNRLGITAEGETFFFTIGWFFIFFGLPLGNTSLGMFFLLINALLVVIHKKVQLGRHDNRIYLQFMLFLFTMTVSAILSERKEIAFASTLGYFLIVQLIVFGAGIIVKKELLSKALLPTLLGTSFISALIAIYRHWVLSMQRAGTLFTGDNGLGTLLIIFTPLSLGYLEDFGNKRRYLMAIYLAVVVAGLFATFSRGAWLGFLAMSAFYFVRNKKSVVVFFVVLVIIMTFVYGSPSLHNRFESIFKGETFASRIYIWKATINIIKDHPLLGVGAGVYPYIYSGYRLPDSSEPAVSFAHNIILQVAAEFGVIGLGLFLSIVVVVLKMGVSLSRTGNLFERGLTSALIGVLIHQQVDNTIYGIEIGGAFWLVVGLIIGFYQLGMKSELNLPTSNGVK